MKTADILEKLLANCLLWGIIAICSFIALIILTFVAYGEGANITVIFVVLLFGFLWIGATSIYRHSFVLVKRHIGKEISIPEFLSTQFIVFLFPFAYMKLKKEVNSYRKKL